MVRALAPLVAWRAGGNDPTTRIEPGCFRRASFTPTGPVTLQIEIRNGRCHATAWGPGADRALEEVPRMFGEHDPGHRFDHGPPALLQAQRAHPDLRIGGSGTLYHDLLVTVLGQRITAAEAFAQWARLVRALGEPAPGPHPDLLLPPRPEELAARPAWWFHPLGIDGRRAETLRAVARIGDRVHGWVDLPPFEVARRLGTIPGIGEWTTATVRAVSMADADAVPVGDFHLKHLVVFAFTGRARGTDEEMLELLAPFAPHRGRVIRLLQAAGIGAPRRGPRRAFQPIADR